MKISYKTSIALFARAARDSRRRQFHDPCREGQFRHL